MTTRSRAPNDIGPTSRLKKARPTVPVEEGSSDTTASETDKAQPDIAQEALDSTTKNATENAMSNNTDDKSVAPDLVEHTPPPEPVDPQAIINPGYLPDEFIARLHGFLTFADPKGLRYSPVMIPNFLGWGKPTFEIDDLDKYLCINNNPVRWWLVGRIKSSWFFTKGGDPDNRVNVALGFLRHADLTAATHLLNNYCRPIGHEVPNTVYASKFMSYRSKGETALTPGAFKRVYDATERYGPKSTMNELSAAMLSKNDIVLVECFLTRWPPSDRPKHASKWASWRCGFELTSVSLLFSAPDTSKDIELDVGEETSFM